MDVVAEPATDTTPTDPKLEGRVSRNVAPTTGLGPLFRSTSVKVTVLPTATLGVMLTLVKLKSATGATTSWSAAVHTPPEQFGLGFVLLKPGGGAMLATLRTVVCAIAVAAKNSKTASKRQDAKDVTTDGSRPKGTGDRCSASKMVPAVVIRIGYAHP